MLWSFSLLFMVQPVSALGPCVIMVSRPSHIQRPTLIPQSHLTSCSSFTRRPRMHRKSCAPVHCGARPLAPWLLALWRKSTSIEMNLQAALISPAGSALGSQRSRRRHSDTPLEQQLKMCYSRPAGACTVGSPTEQLAGCPTPAECQS